MSVAVEDPRTTTTSRAVARRLARREVTGSSAVALLQVFAVTLYVFPSDTVIKAIGASAYVAGLVGLLAFAAWIGATAIGVHRPRELGHPLRKPVVFLWFVGLVSYMLMNREERPEVVGSRARGRPRWWRDGWG